MAVDSNPFLPRDGAGTYAPLSEPDLLDGQPWPQTTQPQGWSRKRKAAYGLVFTVAVFLGGSGAGWHFREMAMKPLAPVAPPVYAPPQPGDVPPPTVLTPPRPPPPALPPGESYPPVPPLPRMAPAPPTLPPPAQSPPPSGLTFTCAPDNDPNVCNALSDFFYATNGLLWANHYSYRSWMNAATGTETDICTLESVSCVNNVLSAISLYISPYQSEFVGTLPTSFGNLASLRSLKLFDMPGLTGSFPASMGRLTGLVSLDIEYTGLTGTIPSSWASLTSLQYLSLTTGNANLCGTVPPNLAGVPPLSDKPLPPC